MSCTSSHYPFANRTSWTNIAPPIINNGSGHPSQSLAHTVWQNFSTFARATCSLSDDPDRFALQDYSLQPGPSNHAALEQAGQVRKSTRLHVGHLMSMRRPKLLQASVSISRVHQ